MAYKKGKIARVGLYIILAFLVLFAGATLVFNLFYKGYVLKHIDAWVYKGTDSVYHASVRNININLLTDKIVVQGINVWPDTTSANFKKKTRKPFKIAVGVTVAQLELNDLQIIKLLRHKIVSFGDVYIRQPRVWIESTPSQVDSTDHKTKTPAIKGLTSENIHIIDPNITYKYINPEQGNYTCTLAGGKAILSDWRLDSTRTDTSRFLLAKSCIISGVAVCYNKPSTLYIFKAGVVDLNTAEDNATMKNVDIEPPMTNDKFYSILGHRTTICRMHTPAIKLAGFNIQGLMHRHLLKIEKAWVDDMRLNLYFNYVIPSHPVNMLAIDPHMLLHNAGLKIDIADITLRKANIKYTEKEETSKLEESIPFRDVNAHITNVTNIPNIIALHPHLQIKAHGIAFQKGDLSATFSLGLADTLGPFIIEANLENVDATDIRKQARILAQIEVDTLQIQKIHVFVSGNRDTAWSLLHVVYHEFKMKLLRVKADKQLVPMPINSLVAKTFFVYSDNPMQGKELRVTATATKRDPQWAYFGSIIKNVKLGARHTLTNHPKVVDAIVKGNKDKNKVLKFIKHIFTKKKKATS
ncbi:MAG: hypothetical protein P4L41_10555 [Flavipsychrobacter sp.]|nr:hypothetical protein [Flavipsychrobacter sp.]